MNNRQTTYDRTREEWLRLAERYFEAETSETEEAELRRFLATPDAQCQEFDELRAVMGYLATGRRLSRRQHSRSRRHTVMRYAVAASVACVVAMAGWMAHDMRSNQCVVYIGGERYTDEAIVRQQMQLSLQAMGEASATVELDNQLSDMFNTLNEE